MENGFDEEEMKNLNPNPDPDPQEDKGETSFTSATGVDGFTRVDGLSKRTGSELLSDNIKSLKETVQKQKEKRLLKIKNLRKEIRRLARRESIELEEIKSGNRKEESKTKGGKTGRERIGKKQKELDRLNNLEIEEEEETSFINPPDSADEATQKLRIYTNQRNAKDFFTNVLDLGPYCSNPKFVGYLIENDILSIKRNSSTIGDYSGKFLGENFQPNDDPKLLRNGIRLQYNNWSEREMNKILKKAGIGTAIGLSIIALATGLGVGLTRKGADMVHQAKMWEKLTPAKKKSKSIPWTELEKATGRFIIFTGEHIVIIITLVGIYLYSK